MSNFQTISPSTPRPYVPSSSGSQGSGTTPKGGCAKLGCVSIFVIIILIAGAGIVGYLIFWPMLFPNDIGGEMLDLTYATGKDGKGYLWIQTDPSFKYIESTESPGHQSTSVECLFCRTETFIYDPQTKTVINKFTTDYDGPPPIPKMFSVDGNVWIVSSEYRENEPIVNVYDAATGEHLMDTKEFTTKNSRFSAGISQLRFEDNPPRLGIKTKDGLDQVYLIQKDTTFKSTGDYNDYAEKNISGNATIYMLANESGSTERKVLYRITGPAGKIFSTHIPESMIEDGNYIMRHYQSTSKSMTPDRVYLEGEILYFDDEGVVIFHQDQLGKRAERLLSRIDNEGNVKWTRSTKDDIFEELKLDEDEDPFNKMFFLNSKLKGDRGGEMFIFKVTGLGIMCFDWNTGEKIWEMEL